MFLQARELPFIAPPTALVWVAWRGGPVPEKFGGFCIGTVPEEENEAVPCWQSGQGWQLAHRGQQPSGELELDWVGQTQVWGQRSTWSMS